MNNISFKIGDRVIVQSNNYNNCGISKGDIGTIKSFLYGIKDMYAYVSMDTADCPSLSWEHNMWYIRLEDVTHKTPPTYWDPSQNKEVAYENPSGYWDWDFLNKFIYDLNLIKGFPELDDNSINTHEKTECAHVPTLYQGFTESYHFCKKCDKRLD